MTEAIAAGHYHPGTGLVCVGKCLIREEGDEITMLPQDLADSYAQASVQRKAIFDKMVADTAIHEHLMKGLVGELADVNFRVPDPEDEDDEDYEDWDDDEEEDEDEEDEEVESATNYFEEEAGEVMSNRLIPSQAHAMRAMAMYAAKFPVRARDGETIEAWWERARDCIGKVPAGENFIAMMDILIPALTNTEISRARFESSTRVSEAKFSSFGPVPTPSPAAMKALVEDMKKAGKDRQFVVHDTFRTREEQTRLTGKGITVRGEMEIVEDPKNLLREINCTHCKVLLVREDLRLAHSSPTVILDHFYLSSDPKEGARCKQHCGCMACSSGRMSLCRMVALQQEVREARGAGMKALPVPTLDADQKKLGIRDAKYLPQGHDADWD